MELRDTPAAVAMMRPASFSFNPQTASSNTFQQLASESEQVHLQALQEFDNMDALLRANDIGVIVFEDDGRVQRPDAVFLNNWFSTHPDGSIALYPMLTPNRRAERRPDVIDQLKTSFEVSRVLDFSKREADELYLEGTGSVVFDHHHKLAYMSRSPRSSEQVMQELARELGYRAIVFNAYDANRVPVYHTNVLLGIGKQFAVVCLDAIPDDDDQEMLLNSLGGSGKKVIAISFEQMQHFAGNVFEVLNAAGEPHVLISATAWKTLLPGQVHALSALAEPVIVTIPTIEYNGGGSVRCMVAGIHLRDRTE